MDNTKIVSVTNRSGGRVVYHVPDRNIRRSFSANETKKIELDELRQLSYVSGGEFILKNCLIVDDKSALEVLNLEVEPEYFYTETEIKQILTTGTLDELEDTLNFAPEGVLDLIKKIAVEEEIPDTRKRKMISEKTGLNVDNAIYINHIMDEKSGADKAETTTKTRKASPITVKGEASTRKAASASKYKIVSEK